LRAGVLNGAPNGLAPTCFQCRQLLLCRSVMVRVKAIAAQTLLGICAHPEAAHGMPRATSTRSPGLARLLMFHHCRKEKERVECTYLLSG
jgi:hypothetical protein